MTDRGYSFKYAERIYKQICGFGEYGFPESHSASFAVLAYTSSWIKFYYPAAFYVGLLNSWPMGFYSPAQLIQDAKRHKIEILPVCINSSGYDHCLEYHNQDWTIRLGIRLVKGVNKIDTNALIAQRPSFGFTDINQIKRLNLSRHFVEAIASANAFHSLCENRYATRWLLMDSESDLPLFHQQKATTVSKIPEPTQTQILLEDYQSTTLSLDTHPIFLLRKQGLLPRHTTANILKEKAHQSHVSVVGLVIGRQRPSTSKGVTFITLEDDTGNINIVVWLATSRAQTKAYLKSSILQVKGILERGDGDVIHIIAGRLVDLSNRLDKLVVSVQRIHLAFSKFPW